MSLKTILLLAFAALAIVPMPFGTSAPDECVITGTTGSPPCLATDLGRAVGANPYSTTCPSAPAVDPVQRTACKPYYVVLVPDYDGNLVGGLTLESRIIWQENNNCPGLQRSGGAGCIGADLKILA